MLNSMEKPLEALETIEECYSVNFRKQIDFIGIKFGVLMKLGKLEEAGKILPIDEECKRNKSFSDCLAFYKFTSNKFDEIPELLEDSNLSYLIEIYSLSKKQFGERKELLSNEMKMEIVGNLHLLYTWICSIFDDKVLYEF